MKCLKNRIKEDQFDSLVKSDTSKFNSYLNFNVFNNKDKE